MRVGIHQPHYVPWLRYLQKIAASDVFIVLDDVAYTKNGWQNRNKIKCATGWTYLTVPVQAGLNQPIREVAIAPGDWACKHLRTLESNYRRAPFYDRYVGMFTDLYSQQWKLLRDLNDAMLCCYLKELGIETRIVRSSDLNVDGAATERLVNLCRAVGGTSYLSGEYAVHAYLDAGLFERAGIDLEFQRWSCPEYAQQFPKMGFIPDLSIVDLLFNIGPESMDLLRRGGAEADLSEPALACP